MAVRKDTKPLVKPLIRPQAARRRSPQTAAPLDLQIQVNLRLPINTCQFQLMRDCFARISVSDLQPISQVRSILPNSDEDSRRRS